MKSPLLLLCVIAFILTSGCETTVKEEPKRPNIVFIMSDDHAYQAISAYDDRLIQTPNIDRIAEMGMLFTNASVTNSICAPSRATILTGKHSHINGKIDNHFPFDTTNVTFPQILKNAGYQTAMFGKLHFGNSPKGFDQFKILPGQGSYYNPDFITKNEGEINVSGYVTDIITDMTLDWLQNERNKEDPFMLMYLHKAPHRSWLMAERHMDEFTTKTFPEPETLFDDYAGRPAAAEAEMSILKHLSWSGDSKIFPETMDEMDLPEIGIDKLRYEFGINRLDSSQLSNFRRVYTRVNNAFKKAFPSMSEEELMKWRYQRYMQDYLGTIQAVDENVGRLLDHLEAHNLMENTIIVYTSDHGEMAGEHGSWWKQSFHEASARAPMMISLPEHRSGLLAPSVARTPVALIDLFPTVCELAGADFPEDLDGVSHSESVREGSEPASRPIVCDNLIPRWGKGSEF
ncbi:MAG TPA: sulfatase-like hydrolase/transferase, partial [Eudoraea sp.]|nr:sulfatase-like hydrolase/transferase [Eudoraea sp.]